MVCYVIMRSALTSIRPIQRLCLYHMWNGHTSGDIVIEAALLCHVSGLHLNDVWRWKETIGLQPWMNERITYLCQRFVNIIPVIP